MACPILTERPSANNEACGVIHRCDPHESCVFHNVHNLCPNLRNPIGKDRKAPVALPTSLQGSSGDLLRIAAEGLTR
jgi:hypothetical protein